MTIPLSSDWMKSAVTLDLEVLRRLLMLKICLLACEKTMFELSWLISMMICFLEEPLVVMLSLGCEFRLLSCAMLWILMIFFEDSLENAVMTWQNS